MPAPRIFISSTCYDLKYIRENLKFFVHTLGYEPILSEEGSIYYDPKLHVADACIAEVPACQIFILIIGGCSGANYKDTEKSITNAEYTEAVKAKIPIFALVEKDVYDQFRVYISNKNNTFIKPDQIKYPAVDSIKIFQFIDEVQNQAINNALVPFSDFEEIQKYIKQQWSSMFFHLLTAKSEANRVGDILSAISLNTEKIEFFTRQVVTSIATPLAKLKVEFYDFIILREVTHDLVYWKFRPSPELFLKNKTLDELCDGKISIDDSPEYGNLTITSGGPPYKIGKGRLENDRNQYEEVRKELLKRLKDNNINLEDFIKNT